MARFIVTGSSGKVGSRLASALVSGGHAIVCLDRRDEQNRVDLADFGDWVNVFAGADAVIHLAANPEPTQDMTSAMRDGVLATENVLRATTEHKVRQFVFASSVWADHQHYGIPAAEIVRDERVIPYGIAKQRGEALVRKWVAEDDTRSAVAVRLGWFTGDAVRPPDVIAWLRKIWVSPAEMILALSPRLDRPPGFSIAECVGAFGQSNHPR